LKIDAKDENECFVSLPLGDPWEKESGCPRLCEWEEHPLMGDEKQ